MKHCAAEFVMKNLDSEQRSIDFTCILTTVQHKLTHGVDPLSVPWLNIASIIIINTIHSRNLCKDSMFALHMFEIRVVVIICCPQKLHFTTKLGSFLCHRIKWLEKETSFVHEKGHKRQENSILFN